MSWRYVEPCCGSAAIALALLGATRPLLPYQGSKWRFRRAILGLIREAGGVGVPRRVDLYDAGPWGTVAPCVLDPERRGGVIDALELLGRLEPRAVYEALHQQPVPEDPVAYSAQFLFLQRLAFSGKAVGDRGGRWSSPGFNTSSAYGLPGTERFGPVSPMIPSLVKVLRGYAKVVRPERLGGGRASAPGPDGAGYDTTVVYLDPPYQGSTAYPGGDLDRPAVEALARSWHGAGATVLVSEAEPLEGLVAEGWEAVRIDAGRKDTSPFRGKQAEWVTRSPFRG